MVKDSETLRLWWLGCQGIALCHDAIWRVLDYDPGIQVLHAMSLGNYGLNPHSPSKMDPRLERENQLQQSAALKREVPLSVARLSYIDGMPEPYYECQTGPPRELYRETPTAHVSASRIGKTSAGSLWWLLRVKKARTCSFPTLPLPGQVAPDKLDIATIKSLPVYVLGGRSLNVICEDHA